MRNNNKDRKPNLFYVFYAITLGLHNVSALKWILIHC